MRMLSYAQNFEDVVLDRAFPHGKPGFYLDIGANEPVTNSITKHFYDLGWHGINVEPGQEPFQKLAEERTRDINLNVGVSDVAGEMTLYEFPLSGASTFSVKEAERHRVAGLPPAERTVATVTLAQLCAEHVTGTIDFLSVDVEGLERQVLAGGDWKKWRPRIVVVEATEPTTTIPTHEAWEAILLEADYRFALFDGLNRFYVRSEDADLLPVVGVPANVTDDFTPHHYFKLIGDLHWSVEQTVQASAATRVINASLMAEQAGFAEELRVIRARYEKLDRALTATRAQVEATRLATEEAKVEAQHLREELDAHMQALVEGVGPGGLRVARKITEVSHRMPKAASSVKKVLRVGLQARRAWNNPGH